MIPVICASCGADNDAGRKFCLECGTPLAAACPACGSPNPPAARFCGECGARLAGTAATALPATAPARPGASPAPAVAERRVVSVLFADLVGFTTIAETRDAEEVRDLLSRYFDLARGIVERHGGTIEKFIGDAVMAVWGAPTSHEDDAERAVRAALEVVSGVRGLGPMVHARVGVVTGEAAVTIGAVGEGALQALPPVPGGEHPVLQEAAIGVHFFQPRPAFGGAQPSPYQAGGLPGLVQGIRALVETV